MTKRWRELVDGRCRVSFSWQQRDDGKWVRDAMWGRAERSGGAVEKNLDHLVTGAFESEQDCRRALERAAKAWLHQHG